jgi:hypothetical protein
MWSSFWKLSAVTVILLSVSCPIVAEDPARSDPARADLPELPSLPRVRPLTRSSGYIFAGTVKSVERAAPKRNGVASVLINFHVDQAMRGVRTGQMLAIREWAGLWESGERYRPGERVMLFLYPPSKLGLTSPVGGPMGRFKVDPQGRVVLNPGRLGLRSRRPGVAAPFPERARVSPQELVHFLRLAEDE